MLDSNDNSDVVYPGILELPETIESLEKFLQDIPNKEVLNRELELNRASKNWRVHIKLVLAGLYFNDLQSNIEIIWQWLKISSQASPQLLLVLASIDKDFFSKCNESLYVEVHGRLHIDNRKLMVLSLLIINHKKFEHEELSNLEYENYKLEDIREVLTSWQKGLIQLKLLKSENLVEVITSH